MNTDLSYYVKIYKGIIPEEVRDQILSQTFDWKQHTFYNPKTNVREPDSEYEPDVSYLDNDEELSKCVWNSYYKYITDLDFPWFQGWVGYSQIRYNRYTKGNVMSEHCDHIHSLFDGDIKGIPILTALGSLNDDYQGGELIMWGDTQIVMEAGDIVVFPSSFLFPHRVEPVTEGERYTFVSWSW
jgi:hypothetical protein